MAEKNGKLSINSENMLPIIKKWLYSDHDIFVREMVANCCDAITKLKKLEGVGEYTAPEGNKYRIDVIVDPQEKTLKFIDNGIGMTEDEVVEYITQIAFSGATEFLEKYKGKTDEDQMIGHFGLGFYSSFMVADEVHIDTLSYLDGAKAVHWESDGQSEYTMSDSDKDTIGTEITLYLNDESYEFCNEYRVREVLQKYCSFMPVEIFLKDAVKEAERIKEEEEAAAKAEEAAENGDENAEVKKPEPRPEYPVNDIHPLWTKLPKDCAEHEYKDFYRKVFHDYKEPLFWIHLNMDYPYNLRGILYFPQINTQYDALEAEIKLYNNQVFIADNIKEVIPEFLMAMKGVIDCPDLPLNVSRSALQNDGSVKKIAEYISRKFADKLSGMCKTSRDEYEKNWDNISPFIKFGCLKDDKFADRMMDYILFKDLDGVYLTLSEYKEKNNIVDPEDTAEDTAEAENAEVTDDDGSAKPEAAEEPEKSVVYYVTDEVYQAQYINMLKDRKKDAVILNALIDPPFITQLETRNPNLRFDRVDSVIDDALKNKKKVSKKTIETLSEIIKKHTGRPELNVDAANMKDKTVPAVLTLSEEGRRIKEMMMRYGMDPNTTGGNETLTLNAAHPLVQYILDNEESEKTPVICKQLYDLAALSHRPLTQDEMAEFIKRSSEIMVMMTES